MNRWPAPIVDADPRLIDAQQLGLRARTAVATIDKPVRLIEACRLAQASVRLEAVTVAGRPRRAMLLPAEPGFTIFLNPLLWGRNTARQWARRWARFVLAHELGHTFFYRPGRRPTRTRRANAAEESFCHRFATSLLVPATVAEATPLTPGGLLGLSDRYEVPLSTAALAMLRLRPDVSILWLRHQAHPRTGDRETMRVQWSAGTRFFARGESLKSPLATLAPGEHAISDEELYIASRRERLTLEAWRFKKGSMLAVLHHEEISPVRPAPAVQHRPPSGRQLSLLAMTSPAGGGVQLTMFE